MKRLLSIAGGIFLILAGLEISLHLINNPNLEYYRRVKLLHAYHPEYYVGLMPGTRQNIEHYHKTWSGKFQINSLGYRGPEVDFRKEHIVCVGDSLVMGFGVSDEETFCALLDGVAISGKSYESVNLGVDAFGSVGNFQRLREASKKLKIKKALYFVSPNDFTLPESLKAQGILPDDEISEKRARDPSFNTLFYLQFEATRLSYLLHAIVLSIEQLKVRFLLAQHSVRQELAEAGFLPGAPAGSFTAYIKNSFYRKLPDPVCGTSANTEAPCPGTLPAGVECLERPALTRRPLPEVTQKAYKELIELSRVQEFELIIVFLPMQLETHHCYLRGKHSPFYDFALRSEQFFKEQKIRTIDLRPYIGQMCKAIPGKSHRPTLQDFYIPADGHLTPAGNIWAARALRAELEGHAF